MPSNVNPNNWHWVEQSCLPWAKEYLRTHLKSVSVVKDGYKVSVTDVGPITGDCDITQRKGRVRCLIEMVVDFNIKLEKDGKEKSSYHITLPEFEHDQLDQDYQFQIQNGNSSYKPFIRKEFIPKVITVFKEFQPDLLEDHQNTLRHNVD